MCGDDMCCVYLQHNTVCTQYHRQQIQQRQQTTDNIYNNKSEIGLKLSLVRAKGSVYILILKLLENEVVMFGFLFYILRRAKKMLRKMLRKKKFVGFPFVAHFSSSLLPPPFPSPPIHTHSLSLSLSLDKAIYK